MPELQLLESDDLKNAFGPLFVPFIPTLAAASILFFISLLIPRGVFRQIFGIISMVLLVAIYIFTTADTAMNW